MGGEEGGKKGTEWVTRWGRAWREEMLLGGLGVKGRRQRRGARESGELKNWWVSVDHGEDRKEREKRCKKMQVYWIVGGGGGLGGHVGASGEELPLRKRTVVSCSGREEDMKRGCFL